MFSDDSDEYLLGFKDFLLAQQAEKEDPVAAVLVAEIYRELLRRVERTPVRLSIDPAIGSRPG